LVTLDCKEKQDKEGSLDSLECQVHLVALDLKVIEDTPVT